jgi:isoleucyl-tRNA synthetase
MFRNLTGAESVHLSHIELHLESETDTELEEEMLIAQKIVYLVRAMRVKFNLKTRQPLRQIIIPVTGDALKGVIEKMKSIILEEVNVKELNFVGSSSGIINKKAKLNFKAAGKKLGKDVKKVAEIVQSFTQDEIREIESKGSIRKQDFDIALEDVEVKTENIEGWIIESLDNITVALDTTLDEELVNEGIAREFASKIQNIRKEQLLGVNDKIKIDYFSADSLLSAVITKMRKYIEEQTMAVEMHPAAEEVTGGYEEININGKTCKVSILKI